jgi:hypothetical protein
MRIPRVRFTVRWLMVAVAVAAVLFAGVIAVQTPRWRRLSRAFASRANLLLWKEKVSRSQVVWFEAEASSSRERATEIRLMGAEMYDDARAFQEPARGFEENASRSDRVARKEQGRAAYFAALARKYHRAARYPFLPVPPDPPEPE